MSTAATVLALSGGIGGAKLALGLQQALADGALAVVCNPGDDFEHFDLTVCPDLDTVTYTLGGLANRDLGWGRAGETWTFMSVMESLGGETWFRLGDGDLALHVERTRRLRDGERLSAIADDFRRRLAIPSRVLPATDDPVRTVVHTEEGDLAFQRYFVGRQCQPVVTGFTFEGARAAAMSPEVEALLDGPLRAVVICPSNPFISIDPILSVPGLRDALSGCTAPVVAVSPIVGGDSVKGPTAKMMRELGLPISNRAIADRLGDLLDGIVIDESDAGDAESLEMPVAVRRTMMRTDDDKAELARATLEFAAQLG